MLKDWTLTSEWYYVKLVLEASCAIIVSFIFLLHLPRCKELICNKTQPVTNENGFQTKILSLFPYGTFIFYSLMGYFSLFGDLSIIDCRLSHPIANICYAIAKLCLYQCFYAKLYIVYSNSYYSFKLHFLVIISVLIFIYGIIMMIFIWLNMQSIQLKYGCINDVPMYLLSIGAFLDQFISFLSLYLFIKPLKQLILIIKKQNNPVKSPQNDSILEFQQLIIKSCTLISVAVFSSFFILMIVAVFGGTAFIQIDGIINCICITLMHKKYRKIYRQLCCLPINIFQNYCYKWCIYNSDIQDQIVKLERLQSKSNTTSLQTSNE